ncbi:hypothetical protein ACFWHW_03815 [Streptomyces pharetrae]|uniref:hypothetical protein n=1 Tax=Streptomyces pharetrae TaxID=291370 RepID=UPI003661859E
MTHLLTAVVALAAGWTLGHRTRPHPARTRACSTCDEAAVRGEFTAFHQLIAGLDLPDDPRNTA